MLKFLTQQDDTFNMLNETPELTKADALRIVAHSSKQNEENRLITLQAARNEYMQRYAAFLQVQAIKESNNR